MTIKILDVPRNTMRPIEAFWGNRVTVQETEGNLYDLTFHDAGLMANSDDNIAIFNKEIGTYSTLTIADFYEIKIL